MDFDAHGREQAQWIIGLPCAFQSLKRVKSEISPNTPAWPGVVSSASAAVRREMSHNLKIMVSCQASLAGSGIFFLVVLGRVDLTTGAGSGGGIKESFAVGCRIAKWEEAIFRLTPSLNWITANEVVTSSTLPAPHSRAPAWLTILPVLIVIDSYLFGLKWWYRLLHHLLLLSIIFERHFRTDTYN
jgi:hypothetical protein